MGSDTFPRPEDISKEGESRRPSKRLKPGDDTVVVIAPVGCGGGGAVVNVTTL